MVSRWICINLLLIATSLATTTAQSRYDANEFYRSRPGSNRIIEDIKDDPVTERPVNLTALRNDQLEDAQDDLSKEYYIWNKEEYPNPILQPKFCRRNHPSTTCDPEDILTKVEARNLEKMIHKIGSQLDCYCDECPVGRHGLTIGIALMNGIYRPYATHPRENAIEFADYLRNKWKLGTCENDVVILIAIKDQQIFTSMGQKARDILPETAPRDILEASKAHFANGHYYQGLESMIGQYYDTLSKEELRRKMTTLMPSTERVFYKKQPERSAKWPLIVGIVFGVICLIIIISIIIWMIKRRSSDDDTSEDTEWQSLWSTLTWRKKVAPSTADTETKVVQGYQPVATSPNDNKLQRSSDEPDIIMELDEEEEDDERPKVNDSPLIRPTSDDYAQVYISRNAKAIETEIP
ncbi:hypothetical protein HDE_00543 [Halotydeus destructor]|nr:hypothetical protein HDE_00543 [Halotydeus destructor]